MQAAGANEALFHYLLHSARLGDERARSDSIVILTAREIGKDIFYIVTYASQQQQQVYVSMKVSQVSSGSWKVVSWGMMGGTEVGALPQKTPPELAWSSDCYSHVSYLAIAVLPNEREVRSVCLKENGGHVFDGQLENGAIYFILPLRLQKPFEVELFDAQQRKVSQKTLGATAKYPTT
jgi:hypothetical protein